MLWYKITFEVKKDQLDSVSERLEAAGAQAVTIEDAGDDALFDRLDGEKLIWENSLLTGLFNAELDLDGVLAELAASFSPDKLPQYQIEQLPDQDWERSWMDRFKPIHYGHDLWICPTWIDPPQPEATNIMLDPGLAFGSGTHETTSLCMQWLATQQLAGKKVIDFGCGSGVLAIAALKLGASSALGIDIDPQALQASRSNAETNNVSEKLELLLPSALADDSSADIVFANILAGTLIELKTLLLNLMRPQAVLILSGILHTQESLIVEAFSAGNSLQIERDGDWLLIRLNAL